MSSRLHHSDIRDGVVLAIVPAEGDFRDLHVSALDRDFRSLDVILPSPPLFGLDLRAWIGGLDHPRATNKTTDARPTPLLRYPTFILHSESRRQLLNKHRHRRLATEYIGGSERIKLLARLGDREQDAVESVPTERNTKQESLSVETFYNGATIF